jgi:GT2 family glycosyltransferase
MQKQLSTPGVVCVSGPYVLYDVPKWKSPLVAAYWALSAFFTKMFTGHLVVGGNWAAPRAAIQKIGGFDTSIEFFGEDTDIGRRMKQIGTVVYSSKCWLYSSARRVNSEGLLWPSVIYILNYFWVAIFHRPLTTKHKDIR